MATPYAHLKSRLNSMLEDEARQVAEEFAINFRNRQNPLGKEYIVVYGGNFFLRNEFVDKVHENLPREVGVFILKRDKKIGFRELEEDNKAFYVDFNGIFKKINNPPQ